MSNDGPDFFDPAEDCPERTPHEIFSRRGYTPQAPIQLTDRQLPGRLWELLYAAAARRLFFCFTNHLDDRDFYSLLWDQWLNEPTADIPPDAGTNTTWIISDFNTNGMGHEEIWLRYYATKCDRAAVFPGEIMPPHEDPPHDRDRSLPTPPIPLDTHAGWLPGDDNTQEDDEPDPLGLAQVDREIADAKNESAAFPVPFEAESDDPLHAMEPKNWTPPAQQLAAQNIPLLPPAEITDETLPPILWELLHNLSLQGFYVLHTDHLDDPALYAELWERGLRDPACLPGRNPRGGWFHDFLGSWGDEEFQLWLRFYATDEEREERSREYPDDAVPAKERPPANRDWRLPKGPF